MPKTKISEFSSTPANNTDIDSINIAEGCAPSGINDAIRELMAQLKDFQTGAVGDSFNGPIGTTTAAAGAFTSLSDSGNLTFTGTGNRITGDFSNATIANRVVFQTSTTNSNTFLSVLPTGTGSGTFTEYYQNGTDPANSSVLQVGLAGGAAVTRINSTITGTGTYLPLTMSTGGSERLRIDTSGNVGIGTSSLAGYRVSVKQSANTSLGAIGIASINSANDTYIGMGYNATSDTCRILASYDSTGSFKPISFLTSDAERMRIDTAGGFAIGKTQASESAATGNGFGFAGASSDPYFSVVNVSAGGGNACIYLNKRTTGSIQTFQTNDGSVTTGTVGSISHNGSNTAYNTSSDYRLKEDVQPMTGALAKVAALKPVTYTWKSTGLRDEGFIAHEVQEVCPSAVYGEKDALNKDGSINPQGIDASFLVATLTAAIQEQQALIQSLTDRITALEAA